MNNKEQHTHTYLVTYIPSNEELLSSTSGLYKVVADSPQRAIALLKGEEQPGQDEAIDRIRGIDCREVINVEEWTNPVTVPSWTADHERESERGLSESLIKQR